MCDRDFRPLSPPSRDLFGSPLSSDSIRLRSRPAHGVRRHVCGTRWSRGRTRHARPERPPHETGNGPRRTAFRFRPRTTLFVPLHAFFALLLGPQSADRSVMHSKRPRYISQCLPRLSSRNCFALLISIKLERSSHMHASGLGANAPLASPYTN
jgi:hypothetical protein